MNPTPNPSPLVISDRQSGSDYLAKLSLANPTIAEQQLMHLLDSLLKNPPDPGVLLGVLEQARLPIGLDASAR